MMDPRPGDSHGGSSTLWVEVCVGSLEDAQIVAAAGLRDIELNSALPLGGLTPSVGLVETIANSLDLNVIAMCRPRAGGFFYSEGDWQVLLEDAKGLLRRGVAGIAVGTLSPSSQIDIDRLKTLRDLVADRTLVFHRAFDLVPDQVAGLEALIQCGVDRVLTSGGKATASLGSAKLKKLVTLADGRIEILAGSGITAENCRELVTATGVRAIHGTFSRPIPNPGYGDGSVRFAAEDDLRQCDPDHLQRLIATLANA